MVALETEGIHVAMESILGGARRDLDSVSI